MSKENKLIPELRFPEFEKDGEWEHKTLDQTGKIVTGKTPSTKDASLWDGEILFITPTDIEENQKYQLVTKRTIVRSEKLDILPEGSIAYTCIASIGKMAITSKESVTNQQINSIVANQNYHNEFIYYSLLHFTPFIKSRPATSTLPIINKTEFSGFAINIPKPQEQQKIASCLSSLDELIAAHNDKLQALKDHKKSLMQNLFPQEGQKVPNYRFPGFEDYGEWVEKKLGEIGEPLMCKRIFKDQTTPNPENGIPFYKIGTFGKEADAYIPEDLYIEYMNKYNYPNKGDILISASGTIGRLVIYDGSPAYYQDSNIVWLGHDESLVTNEFLFYCYSIVNWQTSDGGVIKRLYNSDLKNVSICFPENDLEQQKIASCLSALDELITAQSEKIEQLQQHKKGLMQGLFPKIV